MTSAHEPRPLAAEEPGGAAARHAVQGMADDLRHRSVHGATIMLGAQGFKLVLMIGSTAVLARLLTPEDFGLLAMVIAITNFVAQFRDLGLTTAVVQREQVSQAQLSTLFWINLGFGALLTLLTMLLAPAIAWLYSEPRLTLIAFALAAIFVLNGFAAQHQALLRRGLRFRALAIVEAAGPALAISAAVIAAVAGAGYWALVILHLTTAAVLAVGLSVASGWCPGPPAWGTGVRPFLAFGGHLAAAQVLDAAKISLQLFLLGRFWGAGVLGYYSRANYLLLAPLQQLSQPVNNVAIPVLSRLQADPERFRSFYRHGVQIMALVGMPISVLTLVAAEPLVLTLLGDQWRATIPLVRTLAPAAFVTSFAMATGWLYVAQGQTERQLRWMVLASVIFTAGAVVGLQWGALGVAAAASVVVCGLRLPGILYCLRTMPVTLSDLFGVLWRPAVASMGAGLAELALHRLVRFELPAGGQLALDVIVFSVAYLAAWLVLPRGPRVLRDVVGLLALLRSSAPHSRLMESWALGGDAPVVAPEATIDPPDVERPPVRHADFIREEDGTS